MEANTQPILCCIGGSVAGNPTQFVMERALAEAELDWRVITVEVEAQDLSLALQGLQAMKFSAAQFLEPYRGRIAAEMFAEDRSLNFIGEVTSARLDAASWIGWNSTGAGILRAAKVQAGKLRIDWEQTACLLIGDSPRIRSTVVAIHDLSEAHAVWLDAPSKDFAFAEHNEPALAKRLTLAREFEEAREWLLSAGDTKDQLLVVADTNSDVELLSQLISTFPANLCLLAANGREMPFKSAQEIKLISAADQTVAALAEDYETWTGLPADLSLMRDAYDEYCDF